MDWWEAALLGLIQGLTEFLPVSSSGHLVLGQYVLGTDVASGADVTFEIFVHFGTVLSILTVYWRDVLDLIKAPFAVLAKPSSFRKQYEENESLRYALFILITLVPTGITYIFFKDFLEARFSDPRFASGMLLVTGVLLLLTLLRKNPNGKLTPVKAFFVGVAQSAAMLPGISRSGATICMALYQNVKPEKAANFSFLMLLPVVLGATLLKTLDPSAQAAFEWGPLLIGTVIAYISGIAAIKIMLDFVRKGKLQYFAYYCFLVGILGLILI
ncbi:MAG: undecaprenyl-diphosphate phosphatase [Bacteroidota bacterium]